LLPHTAVIRSGISTDAMLPYLYIIFTQYKVKRLKEITLLPSFLTNGSQNVHLPYLSLIPSSTYVAKLNKVIY
jgi:hypothetical protein